MMRRHLGVGVVHRRLLETGLGDAGPEIVADDLPQHTANPRQRVHVGASPVRQRLAPGCLGVDEARGAEHDDESARRLDLASRLTGAVGVVLAPRPVDAGLFNADGGE